MDFKVGEIVRAKEDRKANIYTKLGENINRITKGNLYEVTKVHECISMMHVTDNQGKNFMYDYDCFEKYKKGARA